MLIICGIPNAGKTTYSVQYDSVVHFDGLDTTTKKKYDRLKELARNGNAVLEGVFGDKRRRTELIECCPLEERKVCIWLDTAVEECVRRENRNRPTNMIRHHAKVFQPPTYAEGWDEIIIIKTETDF